jgi:hypothetical protein
MKPSIGRIVHYVSYGTPGGEYGKECRAAIITEVHTAVDIPDGPGATVGLCVLNPGGQFFNHAVQHHHGGETPGSGGCPNPEAHGSPFRYCACGWAEASLKSGTWHWPERVE